MQASMQYFSETELAALLRAAKKQSERDWLMILVAFNHGLRASEVVGQQPYDVKPGQKPRHGIRACDIRDGHLTVQRLKGSLKTVQALRADENPLFNERDALESVIRTLPANAKVFDLTRVQFWRIVQQHGKTAGLPEHKLHPHSLKHSVAMRAIKKTGIENVRQYLGHKSIASTGEYLKVSDQEATVAVQAVL